MQTVFELDLLFESLKQVIKQRGFTYKKLAISLNMSEAGIKKIFAAQNITIKKIIEICDALEISLVDLIQYMDQNKNKEFFFSEEQEDFFAKGPNYYNFFRQIFFLRKSLPEVKEQFSLSDLSVLKYLKALEKIKLLELHANDRIRFKVYGQLRWRDGGPWMKKYYPIYSQKMTEAIYTDYKSSDDRVLLGYCTLSKKKRDNFFAELETLESKYRNIAFAESFEKGEKVPLSWNFQMHRGDILSHHSDIPNIK